MCRGGQGSHSHVCQKLPCSDDKGPGAGPQDSSASNTHSFIFLKRETFLSKQFPCWETNSGHIEDKPWLEVEWVSFLLLGYSALFINHSPSFFWALPLTLNLILLDHITHYFPSYIHLSTSRSFPEIPWRLLLLTPANTILVIYFGGFNNLRHNPSNALAPHFCDFFSDLVL